ncbi:MAG: HDOD domain-containing protein, partial [Deltaproteobacteria bacterium]|nr:HDOD domain-containing protein [Deltaproteobacteria bacterium]
MDNFDNAVSSFKNLPAWAQVVEMVQEVPQLPATIQKALVYLGDSSNVDLRELTSILESDPGITAKILKVANSSLFSRSKEIANLVTATNLLGLKILKGILIATSLKDLCAPSTDFLRHAWKKSGLTLKLVREICEKNPSLNAEDLATMAIIHNIGEIVLGSNSKYQQITVRAFDAAINEKEGLTIVLEDIIGFKPSLVSALLVKKWSFPDSLCYHILHRDSPLELLSWNDNQLIHHAVFQLASLTA